MLNHSIPKQQRGMTMIELLVALVIFSFGMLGLAGLQTRTISLNQSGLYRSQATALAADILDQMRSSIPTARSGSWNTTVDKDSKSYSGTDFISVSLAEWKKRVELLPDGKAEVTVATSSSGVSNLVTIKIQWDDSRGRDTAQSFNTLSRL